MSHPSMMAFFPQLKRFAWSTTAELTGLFEAAESNTGIHTGYFLSLYMDDLLFICFSLTDDDFKRATNLYGLDQVGSGVGHLFG